MKKACGTWLAIYVALAVAVGFVIHRRFPATEAAVGGGLGGGFVLWLGVAYFVGIGTKASYSRMIRRALSGVPPVDGEKIAAIGRIVPNGGTLTSPLSGSACVAYKYEIRSGAGTDDHTDYEGFALTPSVIQSQQGRTIRLLAWPDFKFSQKTVSAIEAQSRAEEYVRTTEFREPSILNFRKTIGEMMEIYRDDDGTVRFDRRGVVPPGTDFPTRLGNATFYEWVVEPGEKVCVVGRYSAERGGIVPASQPLLDPVTLERGEAEAFAPRAARGAFGYLIGGVIFAGAVVIGLLALFTFVPLDPAEQMSPSMIASWPEIRLERWLETRVRVPLRQKGMLSAATVTVTLPAGSASGRVRAGEREGVVSRAEARRDGDLTTIRIDGDAVSLTVDAAKKPVALRILGQNVDPASAAADITELDANEVAGRLTALSPSPACHVTFRARLMH